MIFRKAVAAGSFYPKNKNDLLNILKSLFLDNKFGPGEISIDKNINRTVLGGISPQAGYRYSGYASAYTFLNLFQETTPDTVIILGPDLYRIHPSRAILMSEGQWESPIGNIEIDTALAFEILRRKGILQVDNEAFVKDPLNHDHSIEIQIPFIKFCGYKKNVKIVPILVSHKICYEEIVALSKQIANAIKFLKKDIVIIASATIFHEIIGDSNMFNQFNNIFLRKFRNFTKSFRDYNIQGTFRTLLDIKTSNGTHTIPCLMLICEILGANQCKCLKYYNSNDIIGETRFPSYTIGYFSGIVINKMN